MRKKIYLISFLMFFVVATGFGQKQNKKVSKKSLPVATNQTAIYKEIFKVDSTMFHAFNNCDSIAYKKFLTNDLEFYHDLGGQHFLSTEMQSVKEMCEKNFHIRRQLLTNTLEVYKLGNFGAVEIGVHRIFHTNPGQTEHISGDYKFVHVWEKKDGIWKLKRVISYGHDKMNNN
jgi:ketosteroid isomerase-like protein